MNKQNLIGSMITILAIGFIGYANYKTNNIIQKKVECTDKPISQPVDTTIIDSDNIIYWEWDSVMDSMDMGCGDSI